MSSTGNTPEARPAPRILIANDQEWAARSLESILAVEGYEVVRAYTGRQALERATALAPDLIILDIQLPDISGPDVCRLLRDDPVIGPGTPIILTTAGSSGRSRQAEALEAGAWDFATQPFDGPLLTLRIRNFLGAKAILSAARREALVDSETGLYNRRGLALKLGEVTAGARRRRESVACLVVSAGSAELVEAVNASEALAASLAQAIRATVRGSDIVGRLSPLDFVIVAPTLNRDGALSLVDRFQRALAAARPPGATAVPLRAGIAAMQEPDNLAPDDLLNRAVSALDWATTDRPVTVSH